MFTLRSLMCATTLAVPMFLAAGAAGAAVVAGSSTGTFSNYTSCDGNCRITNNGGTVEWGYPTILGFPVGSGSTLSSVNKTWSQQTDINDLVLAELVWTNLATSDSATPDDFNVVYTLKIKFTQPNASEDTEGFDLKITNTKNSAGDTIGGLNLADLSNLNFTLNGVQVSDIKYKLVSGAGSTFNNNIWYNPENRTSTMQITADFKAVPEPASLGLLAAGLFGIGVMRRRKNA